MASAQSIKKVDILINGRSYTKKAFCYSCQRAPITSLLMIHLIIHLIIHSITD